MANGSRANLIYTDGPVKQTPYERNKNLINFGFLGIKNAVDFFTFDMQIRSIQEAEPESLRTQAIHSIPSPPERPLSPLPENAETRDLLSDVGKFFSS